MFTINYWVLIFSYPENSHTEDYRQEVLNLVNAQRAKYGLTALKMGDDALTAARTDPRRGDRRCELPPSVPML